MVLAQVPVGRGHNPYICPYGDDTANPRKLTFLKHPQQSGLGLHRHIADLVQKQRPPFGLFKFAGCAARGAREGTLFVAKELRFDEFPGNGRHVQRNERPVLPFAVIVQRAGDQFLAGSRLARDHDRQIGLHEPGHDPVDFLHRHRASDQRQLLVRRFRVGRTGPPLRLVERPADKSRQFVEVERLGKIFVSPAFGSGDRRHDGVLGTHYDNRELRANLLDARQEVERILVGHDHIGNHEFTVAARYPVPQRSPRCPVRANRVPKPGQRLAQHGADRGIVIGDKDRLSGHVGLVSVSP